MIFEGKQRLKKKLLNFRKNNKKTTGDKMIQRMAKNPRTTFWAGIIIGAITLIMTFIMGFIFKEGNLPGWVAILINAILIIAVFLIMYAQIFMYERYTNLKLNPLLAFIALIVALFSFFLVVYLIYNATPKTVWWNILAIVLAFIVMSVIMLLFDMMAKGKEKGAKKEVEEGKEIKAIKLRKKKKH